MQQSSHALIYRTSKFSAQYPTGRTRSSVVGLRVELRIFVESGKISKESEDVLGLCTEISSAHGRKRLYGHTAILQYCKILDFNWAWTLNIIPYYRKR